MWRSVLPLLLCLPAQASEVTLKLERGLGAGSLIQQIHAATGHPLLYAPADVEGKSLAGSIEVALPAAHAFDFLTFALASCGLEVRRHEGPAGPVAVVAPSDPLEARFRMTGLPGDVEFSRPPGSWKGDADVADSLSPAAGKALLAVLRTGDAAAKRACVTLLGLCGARSPEVAAALGEALADDALARDAAWALERFGWFARPALPALEARAAGGTDADLFARAARAVGTALHPGLYKPSAAVARAPTSFEVDFETTKGVFRVRVHREWAPRGADRFYNLVRLGFFDDTAFFRVVKDFVVQFGLSGHPEVNRVWFGAKIPDDPPRESNRRGTFCFATSGKDSRSTQVFVNLADNGGLDTQGFAPLGEVVSGMEVVDKLHAGYREKPNQDQIHFLGAAYLRREFPDLDWIRSARIVGTE